MAARTSCFAFKGKDEDLRVVGEKLGVRHVLEGSVRKAGAGSGSRRSSSARRRLHLWSERYDRELVDIFALQDEIADAIAGEAAALAARPDPTRPARARGRATSRRTS